MTHGREYVLPVILLLLSGTVTTPAPGGLRGQIVTSETIQGGASGAPCHTPASLSALRDAWSLTIVALPGLEQWEQAPAEYAP